MKEILYYPFKVINLSAPSYKVKIDRAFGKYALGDYSVIHFEWTI